MKNNDIAMLILIIAISVSLSYFIGNAIFGGDSLRSTQVEVVELISPEFPQPDPAIFNENSVNLTETINIGETNSVSPFSTGN